MLLVFNLRIIGFIFSISIEDLKDNDHYLFEENLKWFLLVGALAFVSPLTEALKPGLRVKFNVGENPGVDFFFDIPRTTANAIREGWSLTSRADSTRSNLLLYCPEDRVLCGFFNRTGSIVGLQIAIAKDEHSGAVLDWETQGFTEWNPPPLSGQTQKSYWTTQIFFVSQDTARTTDVVVKSEEASVLVEDAVWVTGINRKELRISADADDIANSIFTEQACISWMGLHYYYNMTADTECTSTGMYPWFPLVYSGKLEGLGFGTFGQLELIEGRRDWFEKPTRPIVEAIVSNGPQCLYEMADSPGLITMHIYFTDEPWSIGC